MQISKQKKIFALAFVAVIAVGSFWYYKNHAAAIALPTDTMTVQAATVKETALPLVAHAIGTLVARSVEITPEMAGHIAKIQFQDGTFIKQGTPLIQLDDAVYKAKSTSSKAQLAYSENNYKRMLLLIKQGAVTKQAIDQAESDVKEKRASALESEVMVDKLKLSAPFDGVVGKSKVNLGDYVTVGQSVVTLTDTKHLRIEYNVPEKFLPLLHLGQEVKIATTTYPDKTFSGKVAFISPVINTDNRSVSLYADVPNDANLLAPGMYVDVKQSLGQDDRVLMIPARSLVPVLDGAQVYKVVKGKAYPVSVLTGKRVEGDIQVIQGLAVGDVIITDGQLKVKNGTPVKILN